MQLVTIEAKSHKGKNTIAQALRRLPNWNGKTWRLKRKETRVLFDSDSGPWGFVEPDTDENTDWCSRWVNLRDDKNFTVTANVEFSGTPAASSPEAPLERRVGGCDGKVD